MHAAIETFLNEWRYRGMDWAGWMQEVERARVAFATLVGASPSEIAIGTSVSQIVSSLVSALVSTPTIERRQIISSEVEFPGVAHSLLASQKYGWTVDLIKRDNAGLVRTHELVGAINDKTALVSAPHVSYAHGAVIDMTELAAAAHAQGALVLIDAYQSIGTLPIDVKASKVDFLVAGTLKYLLGTAGIAFLYVNPALIEHLEPTVTGWFGRQNPMTFDAAHLDYADSAARFDLGTPALINAYAARAGIDLILATGVQHIQRQIERLSALAYRLSDALQLRIAGPQSGEQKGATIALHAGSSEHAHWLEEALHQHSITTSARGSLVRLAPHGFTYEEELERALQTITQLERGQRV